MKEIIRYNNNRNRVFVISIYNNTLKITTYRKAKNNCLKINSVKFFSKGSVIDFRGDNPKIYNESNSTTNVAQLWNARNIYNKWKELVTSGNEWTLYQKDIISN